MHGKSETSYRSIFNKIIVEDRCDSEIVPGSGIVPRNKYASGEVPYSAGVFLSLANLVLQNWGASRMHQENYHHNKALKSASGK